MIKFRRYWTSLATVFVKLLVMSFDSVNYFVYFTVTFQPMLSKTFERSSIKLSTVEKSDSKIEQTP
jgi:hypothetical protein